MRMRNELLYAIKYIISPHYLDCDTAEANEVKKYDDLSNYT